MYYQLCGEQSLHHTAKMSQRLLNKTKWLWCVLALHVGSFWGQTRSVTVRTPPSNPSTIEAQAKFFQDFFSVQLSPYKIEFGHVCEDPNTWEQRYEKKDFKNHRDMGKVRWGDKKGGYGEHYWDLNHAGHVGNHGDDGYEGDHDDGSYHESSNPYDEHNSNSPSYDNEDYDPEKSSYEENERAKRAQPKVKVERKHHRQSESYEETSKPQKQKRKNKEEFESAATQNDEEYIDDEEEEEEEHYKKPKPKRHHQRKSNYNEEDDDRQTNHKQTKDKNHVVLVVSQRDDSEKQNQQYKPQYNPTEQQDFSQYLSKKPQEPPQYAPPKQAELPQYVPYEGGSGVRQHQQPEVSAATTAPRLFLEPSTGHVVDRATGQAYLLQPIATPKTYN